MFIVLNFWIDAEGYHCSKVGCTAVHTSKAPKPTGRHVMRGRDGARGCTGLAGRPTEHGR